MFLIVLQKAGIEKVYAQMFATEAEALEKLNDFRPDFTGYVLRAERI